VQDLAAVLSKFIDWMERFFGAAMKIVDPVFEFVSTVPGWVFIAVLLAPPALIGFVYLRWWFGRRARWEQFAVLSGFTPLDEKASLTTLFPRLSVFADPTDSDVETLWGYEGSSGRSQLWLADFNRRSGKRTLVRTVAVLRVPGAEWPELSLWERKGGVPRGRAGEEPSDVDFDRTFQVEGPDPDAARKSLSTGARAGLVRLASQCLELERRADTLALRLVLRASNQIGLLRLELAGDLFAVCARRCLDPAVARDLLSAAEEASSALGQ
jgi:hypothetical protein